MRSALRCPAPVRAPLPRLVLALAALILGPVARAAPSSPGWTLAWSDEFTGPAGTQPGERDWTYDLGNEEQSGWGNKELEYYTRNPSNVRLDGQGHLEIVARRNDADLFCWNGDICPYTSARLNTRGKVQFLYGKLEARILLPAGRGYWPAFWMLGAGGGAWPGNGEIDVLEWVGQTPGSVYGTLHGPGYSGSQGLSARRELAGPVSGSYHTYTLIKRPAEIIWLMDGAVYHRVTPGDLPAGTKWVFDGPFYLLLNLAVGGNWPGRPPATTVFPGVMKVDYVRLWKEASP